METIFQYFDNILLAVFMLFYFGISLPLLVGLWKIFEKAGWHGAYSFVPVLNLIVLIKVSGKPAWWFFLLLIPAVGWFILPLFVWKSLASKFSKGWGTALGLYFFPLIFIPILGIGSSVYVESVDNQREVQKSD